MSKDLATQLAIRLADNHCRENIVALYEQICPEDADPEKLESYWTDTERLECISDDPEVIAQVTQTLQDYFLYIGFRKLDPDRPYDMVRHPQHPELVRFVDREANPEAHVREPFWHADWSDEQCVKFACVAFRHAPRNLPDGVTLDDIRLGVRAVFLGKEIGS